MFFDRHFATHWAVCPVIGDATPVATAACEAIAISSPTPSSIGKRLVLPLTV